MAAVSGQREWLIAHDITEQSGEYTVHVLPGCCAAMRDWLVGQMPRRKFFGVVKNSIA